ncbi:MAG: hypothetical protein K9G76_05990 [Bacteroidales bacterium]|nr:hypothetical protein [Bacteroidales bacterium]MCF8402421.1 hypothetical protein [Bacteroidales bacterium]
MTQRLEISFVIGVFAIIICWSQNLIGQTLISENFSSGQMPPSGWSIENVFVQWTINNTIAAGGTHPEARFQWLQLVDTTRLMSPLIDLTGVNTVIFQFKHFYDDYDGEGPSVGVATRSGNGFWNTVWEIIPDGNVGPDEIILEISNEDVGQADFQLCCYVKGNLFNLDYWYLDDLLLYRPIEIDIRLFLEGPFQSDQMNNQLNAFGFLPLSQPFNTDPWNYDGMEEVSSIPGSGIIDWVLVELLAKDSNVNNKFKSVAKRAGFIHFDGTVTKIDGENPLSFPVIDEDSIYLWVHPHNHLSVMSSESLLSGGSKYTYDFSIDTGLAIYPKRSMKEISTGVWAVMSGDGNADGKIDNSDKNQIWVSQQGNSGYLSADYNMNGIVDEADIQIYWKLNAGKGHWIPDTATVLHICGDPFIDFRNGNSYSTALIGVQCWMTDNLNYNTGTSWCYYNNSAYCNIYGRLYNWSTIMNGESGSNSVPSDVQGICPAGWHIPSDGEWCILLSCIDSTIVCDTAGYNGTDAGIKMKSTWGWSSGGNGTNESGFCALPGGSMGIYHFDDLYLFANFWTTTEDYPGYAWFYKLNYGLPTIGRYFSSKNRGYSLRCLKN